MKIDLVYLYVDGSDPQWRAKKSQWDANVTVGNAECRFCDNQELRYSLRSVEKYAPWINRIFIVTDNQVPKWLDTSYEKVRVVDHREIIDEQYLPQFNSGAIISAVAKIPELNEHFIYSDDDFFFCNEVQPDFFFDSEGRPIVRYGKKMTHIPRSNYGFSVCAAQNLIFSQYGAGNNYYPHHNMDAYLKSEFLKCEEEFPQMFEEFLQHRFRCKLPQPRFGVLQYMVSRNKAVAKYNVNSKIAEIKAALGLGDMDSLYMASKRGEFSSKIRRYRPRLACINDGVNQNEMIGAFFESFLPEKSLFEK